LAYLSMKGVARANTTQDPGTRIGFGYATVAQTIDRLTSGFPITLKDGGVSKFVLQGPYDRVVDNPLQDEGFVIYNTVGSPSLVKEVTLPSGQTPPAIDYTIIDRERETASRQLFNSGSQYEHYLWSITYNAGTGLPFITNDELTSFSAGFAISGQGLPGGAFRYFGGKLGGSGVGSMVAGRTYELIVFEPDTDSVTPTDFLGVEHVLDSTRKTDAFDGLEFTYSETGDFA